MQGHQKKKKSRGANRVSYISSPDLLYGLHTWLSNCLLCISIGSLIPSCTFPFRATYSPCPHYLFLSRFLIAENGNSIFTVS